MYSHVVFDLDGTLLDTLGDLAAAGNHALSAMGFAPHPVNSYKQMVGHGMPKLVENMLPETCQGESTRQMALCIFQKYYTAHMNDLTLPYPGIPEMLQQLKAAGVRLSLLSNKAHHFVQPIVAQHFGEGVFDVVLGLQEGVPAKPNPTALQEVMRQMGAAPATTLYVGDSDVDMITAANAGVSSCGVLWGFRTKKELQDAGATMLAEDVTQLTEIILN